MAFTPDIARMYRSHFYNKKKPAVVVESYEHESLYQVKVQLGSGKMLFF